MIGEIAALIAALCWAASAVLYKRVLSNVGYLAANLVRSAFAVLFLLFMLPMSQFQSSAITLGAFTLLVFAAFTNLVIGDTFYFFGLKKAGVSRAQPISSTYPLYAMFLAALFLNEALTYAVIIGTPLTVVGIIVVSWTRNKKNDGDKNGEGSLKGVAASIVAALFWSVGLVSYKMALSMGSIDLIYATFIRTSATIPFLLLAVIAGRETKQLRKLQKKDTIMLAVAGILALGLGGILLFVSLSLIAASRAIPLSSVSPLLSLLLASLYAGEKVTAKVVVGTVLIVMGVVLVSFYAGQ
jgi:uncharacterized membrane protein